MARTRFVAVLAAAVMSVPAAVSAQPPPSQPDMLLDGTTRTEVIAALSRALTDAYVFPDVGRAVAQVIEARNARGDYDAVTSANTFSRLLTDQLREAAHDKHLAVAYSSEVLPALPVSQSGEAPPSPNPAFELQHARATNYEFEQVRRLDGNIGYLKFNAFQDAPGGNVIAEAALPLVSNTDALILDLRDNHGGGPAMFTLLASYFFPTPVHLLDLSWRIARTTEYNVTQMWTMSSVSGRRYLDKDVFILTSQRTFSVAEGFADALQSQKRVTVVGETTAGGANGGGPYRLGDHFFVGMPMGRLVNPITRTNWEGKGVQPDVLVPEKDALNTAQRLALHGLIRKTADAQTLATLQQALARLDAHP